MSEIDELLREFPPGVREQLRSAWERDAGGGPRSHAARRARAARRSGPLA